MTAAIAGTIREPRRSELSACRMLLPDACKDSAARSFRLVVDAEGRIEGALTFRDTGQALGFARVHVIGARRRRGIGSSLLDYIVGEAQRLRRERVFADADLKREPGAEAFLEANGFTRISRLTSVKGPTELLAIEWPSVRERTPPLSQLSPEARIVDIADAPMSQLVEMYAAHIAEMPVLSGLERAWRLDHFKESIVLMIGERVIGVMLAEIRNRVLCVPAWIVVPEYRGQLAGLQVRTALIDRIDAKREQYDWIQFDFLDKAQATAKIAQNPHYEVVGLSCRYERRVF